MSSSKNLSFEQGYKLIYDNNKDLTDEAMVHPTRNLVETIAKYVKDVECKGITSIGCGTGILEWFLTESFPNNIIGVDFDKDCLNQYVKNKITFIEVKNNYDCIDINNDYALLFCWGTSDVFRKYLETYKGSCLVIISNETCIPHPPKQSINTYDGWKLVYNENIPGNRKDKYKEQIFIYHRK